MLKTLLKNSVHPGPHLPPLPVTRKYTSPLLHYYIITLLHQYDTYKLPNQLPPFSCLKIPPNFYIITLLLSYIIILSADRLTLLTPPTSWSCIKLPTNYCIIMLEYILKKMYS